MHVKTVAEYKKHNAEDLMLPFLSACDENIKVFMEKAKTSGKPVKREINSIYRLKQGNKEYFIYNQKLSSQDSLENYIECWFPNIGKYEKPSFSFITNPETGAKIADSIRSTEIIYELEWKKDWTPELEAVVVNDIDNLIVIPGNRHYGGFSFDEFKERTFDELVTLGKYGTLNPTPKIIEIENTRRKELDKEKRARI
jgi:hypothetical protein